MKETLKNITIGLLIIFIFIKRPVLVEAIILAINIWINTIFPALFPFLIISDLIISSNIVTFITLRFHLLFKTLFKVSGYGAYVFILSLISGTPSNAKFVRDLLEIKVIENIEAVKILSMSMLYNPLLILAITSFLKTADQAFIIITNIFINLIIGLCNRCVPCNISLVKSAPTIKFNLVHSISKTINTLLLILGAIVLFTALISLLPLTHPLTNGALEIISGLRIIDNVIDYNLQLIFTGILLSFGGLSIQTQMKSILKDYNLDYSLFYKSRIIHLALFLIIIYLIIILI